MFLNLSTSLKLNVKIMQEGSVIIFENKEEFRYVREKKTTYTYGLIITI